MTDQDVPNGSMKTQQAVQTFVSVLTCAAILLGGAYYAGIAKSSIDANTRALIDLRGTLESLRNSINALDGRVTALEARDGRR